jgi:hypothetical protein
MAHSLTAFWPLSIFSYRNLELREKSGIVVAPGAGAAKDTRDELRDIIPRLDARSRRAATNRCSCRTSVCLSQKRRCAGYRRPGGAAYLAGAS